MDLRMDRYRVQEEQGKCHQGAADQTCHGSFRGQGGVKRMQKILFSGINGIQGNVEEPVPID